MKLITLLILLLGLTSCKSDRIDHTDCNYIYVWKYDISGDSALYKYKQPRIIERKVMGGRMKYKKIKVDLNNNGRYDNIVKIPYGINRSDIVRQAQRAAWNRKPLTGVFIERFYPCHQLEFVKYK